MPDALSTHVSRRHNAQTPQSEPARKDQVKNNAGGYTFQVGDDVRLHRFLTIGTTGGTFHVGERELTRDNAGVITGMAERSHLALIEQALEVSLAGRAPSNDQALFALAAAQLSGDVAYRQRALDAMLRAARTGSHLLTFVKYADMFRGWGPQLVAGLQAWYAGMPVEDLAYQVLKYKDRGGWTHRDVLRKAGRKTRGTVLSPAHADLFAYVVKGTVSDNLPPVVQAAAAAHATRRMRSWVQIIEESRRLSWEMLPSEALAEAEVWRALIRSGSLPQTALVRNLARLTTLGVIAPGDAFTRSLAERIADPERLRKARVHPVSLLLALKTYSQGHGIRGKRTWTPVTAVTDALDAAFYAAFPAVENSGMRIESAVDISGTMSSPAGGLPISCRELAAAMSLVTAGTEPQASIYGFGHTYMPLDVSRRRRLDDVTTYMTTLGMQRTDCALPMTEALKHRREVDVFQVLTDNETWCGRIHPHQALEQYRQKMGIDARLQVVAFVPTGFSIADPLDPRMIDVSGFDAAVPNLLSAHARGDL